MFDLSQTFGRVQLTGNTRLAFLHRMSSNDIESLSVGRGMLTVLTSPIGRMVDCVPVFAMDDALILLTGANHAAGVVAWLRKYVLYNDDVKVHDITPATHMLGVWGDGAAAVAQAHDEKAFAALTTQPVYSSSPTKHGLLAHAPPLHNQAGYYLISTQPFPESVTRARTPIAEYENLRVRSGIAAHPNEINESYIPLEAGLWNAVSFSKGCYIGQEIIARMESRNAIAKKLCLLETTSAGALAASAALFVDGNEVGKVTSAANDFALAYVRSAFANVGQMLQVQHGAARVVKIVGN